jgi:hypothetical protein
VIETTELATPSVAIGKEKCILYGCKTVVFSVVTLRSEVSERYTAYIFKMPAVFSKTSGKMNHTTRFKNIKTLN